MSNPTLLQGSMPPSAPGLVAGMSFMGQTPPQTPRSTTSSVSGVKREASESEKEDGSQGGQRKKRRIAPTLVDDPVGR